MAHGTLPAKFQFHFLCRLYPSFFLSVFLHRVRNGRSEGADISSSQLSAQKSDHQAFESRAFKLWKLKSTLLAIHVAGGRQTCAKKYLTKTWVQAMPVSASTP